MKASTPKTDDNYSTIVKAKIGSHVMIYAAETDCCSNNIHTNLDDYCEIKTTLGDSINDLNFENNPKYFHWYIQSLLVGTKTFQIGLRNHEGIVKRIEKLNTDDLRKYVDKKNDPFFCFSKTNNILNKIKENCKDEEQLYIVKGTMDRIDFLKIETETQDYAKYYFIPYWFK